MSRFITATGWYLISLDKDEVLSTKVNSLTQIDKTSTINFAYLVSENKQSLPAPSYGDFTNGNWESVSSSYTATSSLGIWVYATVSSENEWTQTGQDIDGEDIGDYSGWSVSLNSAGNIVAIGADYNDGNGYKSGHTRIYKYNETSWVQLGEDIDGEAIDDQSGYSVSLNSAGDIVAIGAPYNDGTNNDPDDNRGHTRIYQYNGTSWTQLGQDIDGEAGSDQSGESVSLNSAGDIVAIGATRNDGNRGHTRIYQYIAGLWTQIGQDIDGEAGSDESGESVSLNSAGNIVAIGAIKNDGNRGHTRIYEYDYKVNTWTQLGQDIDGEATNDFSGISVSLNSAGDIVAIGAEGNDGDRGHTRIYEYNGTSWVQIGQDIDGEAAEDYSGRSVSLNSAGNIVAIGARFNDSIRGHTRIYQYDFKVNTWTQLGQDIDGEAAGDFSGYSVSLNSAGNIVAIGAIFNNGNGSDAGHTRIFSI